MDKLAVARSQWDRLTAMAAAAAGAVVLIVGWLGVSGTAYPAEQLPYIISAGLGGLFLLGIASVLWLSADLRDEWRKLDRIEQAIRAAGIADAEPGEFHGAEFATAPESVNDSSATTQTAQLPVVVGREP